MKKIIVVILLLTPSLAFAQTIPLLEWPHLVYCTDGDANVYTRLQTSMPGVGGGSDPTKLFEFGVPFGQTNFAQSPSSLIFLMDGSFSQSFLPATDCDNQSISQLLSSSKAFFFVRSSSPKVIADEVAKRKSVDESVTNIATLQNDDSLAVSVKAGKTYSVTGVIFASATTVTPDIKIAYTAPSGSEIAIGYVSTANTGAEGVLTSSGVASERIPLSANTLIPIAIQGTVVAGAGGELQLQWAQFASNAAAVTVAKGSYVKVEEIQ